MNATNARHHRRSKAKRRPATLTPLQRDEARRALRKRLNLPFGLVDHISICPPLPQEVKE